MAQSSHAPTEELLESVRAPSSVEEEVVEDFVREAMDVVAGQLTDQRDVAMRSTGDAPLMVDKVLDPDNVREIQVRAKPLENPRVTVWLRDCPTWANNAWSDTFRPFGINAYNGKVRATFDVRPM